MYPGSRAVYRRAWPRDLESHRVHPRVLGSARPRDLESHCVRSQVLGREPPRVLGSNCGHSRVLGRERARVGGPLSRLVALRACRPQCAPRWSRLAMPPQGLESSIVRFPALSSRVLGGQRARAGGLSGRTPARGASRPQCAHLLSLSVVKIKIAWARVLKFQTLERRTPTGSSSVLSTACTC